MRYPLRHKSAVDEDMLGAGFEPAHPEITELKSAALDQLGHPSEHISGGTRTRNLPLRRRTRCPLRHRDKLNLQPHKLSAA